MKNWIKKLAIGIAACFLPVVAHAFQPVRYVQVSSTTVLSSQKGGIAVDTATFINVTAGTGTFSGVAASTITVSSFTVTGNATFKGIVTATGAVTLGGAGNSVVISSNAVLPGTTIYAPGSNASIVTDTMTALSINVTSMTPTGILGTTTNDNAPSSRDWGFFISSGPTDLRNYPTTGNYTDLASFSLPAGDWDVMGCCLQNINGSTTQAVKCGTSATSGNSWPEENVGYSTSVFAPAIAGSSLIFCGPPTRWSLSIATTIYNKTRADYTVGTPQASGFIRTRRAR